MDLIQTFPGDSSFQLFEEIPKYLYENGSDRETESDKINCMFLQTCFVLIEKKIPLARVALYHNPNLIYNDNNSWCIGNYECLKDNKVAEVILSQVMEYAKKNGAQYLIGPMNGSTWDNYRFSMSNELPNFLLEPKHHVYYTDQFQHVGFNPIAHYISSIDKDLLYDTPKIQSLEAKFKNQGVRLREIDMNQYMEELKRLYPLISSSFKQNFLFTPINWESFLDKYLAAAAIINPEYCILAEDHAHNLIGFVFCYPDLNNPKENRLVLKTLARDSSPRWAGVGLLLTNEIVKRAKKNHFKSVIHAFMMDDGASVGVSNHFSGEIIKKYTLYGKAL